MFTAAASVWLSLGLTRCYDRLAKRRESKSAASDILFLSHRFKVHAAIHAGLNCLVQTSIRGERERPLSVLSDDRPCPQEGIGCLGLSLSLPGFLLRGMLLS